MSLSSFVHKLVLQEVVWTQLGCRIENTSQRLVVPFDYLNG